MGKKNVYFTARIPASIDQTKNSESVNKLLSFIVWSMGANSGYKKKWVPLPTLTLRTLFGANASAVVKDAVNAGYIVLLTHSSGASYSKRKGICKHYRLADGLREEIRAGKLACAPCKHARVYFDDKDKAQGHESPPSAIERAYEGVCMSDTWQDIAHTADFFSGQTYANQIGKGEIVARIGSTGRAYHPLILMSKTYRPFVTYQKREISYIDVKACHPAMLAKFASENEREHWLNLCGDDIYLLCVTDTISRDDVKEAFQVALSDCPKWGAAESIVAMIGREAPSILAWLESQWKLMARIGAKGNSVQAILQKLESAIFVTEFEKMPFWCLPMHDGLALMPENIEEAKIAIQAAAREVLGFELTID